MIQKLYWETLDKDEKNIILKRPVSSMHPNLLEDVNKIIKKVKEEGDIALSEFTQQFDKVHLASFKVDPLHLSHAEKVISDKAKNAILKAKKNIQRFHEAQPISNLSVKIDSGIFCEKQFRPLERVGLYIPGGQAPLISTVLMLGVPAEIAGCKLRVLVTPPGKNTMIDPHILYAASLCGINQIYQVGGAQAIAALAYGTASIPKVDKIFGPGNAWVTLAKTLVALDPEGAAYDLPAGPSEVMVIADDSAHPAYVAADLLSQLEHGKDSHALLVSTSEKLVNAVNEQLEKQQKNLSRKMIISHSLAQARSIIVSSLQQAIEIANCYGPEHLLLQVDNPRQWIKAITCAGSVFLGHFSPEAVGDYASGTNHVLPTYGYAKMYSGLSVADFLINITFQELTYEGLRSLGECVETLAELEGLDAHGQAVSIRLNP